MTPFSGTTTSMKQQKGDETYDVTISLEGIRLNRRLKVTL
jgi:hypothetical protein